MSTPAPEHLLNRDLSWLEFNTRVLSEAENDDVPLLERLKFMSIVSGNMDEFFMVRVALVRRALKRGAIAMGPDMAAPAELLGAIAHKAHAIVARQRSCLQQVLLPSLAAHGVTLVRCREYTDADRVFLGKYFDETVGPVLTPLGIQDGSGLPLLVNCATYVVCRVSYDDVRDRRVQPEARFVFVLIPVGLSRFVPLPGARGFRFAILDDVIAESAQRLLRGYRIDGLHACRVTRDADIAIREEQEGDLLTAMEDEVRSRHRGAPVRLEIDDEMPAAVRALLASALGLADDDVYACGDVLDLASFVAILGTVDVPELRDPPWPPRVHTAFAPREGTTVFDVMRERDVLVHHPYHSFDPVIALLEAAASDPDVLAVKMTLYRVSGDSPVVRALTAAAQNGKQVTVLVELRARFSEQANVHWARALSEAGAQVVHAVVGYKTHGKALLVVRREGGVLRRYVHLGTGNYNDRTARLYTDLGLLTTRREFGSDVSAFFNVITGYATPPSWRVIEIAPTGLRRRLTALIEREVEKHTPEMPGLIRAKMNSLIDPGIIGALYDASAAGVKVELVVRGMCRLRPGIKGLSSGIRVVSVIDRYLEHSRIYHFHNGGNDEVYLSSADLMERNLDRRIEILFPLLDDGTKAAALRVLDVALADNVKAWVLASDGTYARVRTRARTRRRSQAQLYEEVKAAVRRPPKQPQGAFRVRRTPPPSSLQLGQNG